MFSKIYSFVLIIKCGFFFGDVFGNIFLIDTNGKMIKHPTIIKDSIHTYAKGILEPRWFSSPEKYIKCGPLKLDFVIKKKMNAEIYLNYTFEEKNIILNYEGRDTIFEYNTQETNEYLNYYLEKIDRNIEFKIVKIQNSNLDNNTPICNDTVYDVETKNHLYTIQNLSLWKYAKEDLVQSYDSTLPLTTLNNFINNSTIYKRSIEFVITRAIKIIELRTIKYAILLISYAFEAIRIRKSMDPYWDQIKENLNKLSDALITMTDNNVIRKKFYKLNPEEIVYKEMNKLKSMVCEYVQLLLSPEEKNTYSNDLNENNFTPSNINEQDILPQYLLKKILNGFPKPHKDEEFYDIPTNISDIEEKFQKIISLIKVEYTHILEIKF
ncbi:uncharacterized protein LOC126906962 isoform X3 [Daktulosphaira vitifoliae]|uniref:uncharacterized protein LOC126906962 isoform X3 n=1 Tax=Daktulosphaira vitifoliae TaxID=58002 RepID=UPI0021AA2289|nr:uncharacterized protein LOC126906962 isoform X3 [Daktulosphaira vitifoliae]